MALGILTDEEFEKELNPDSNSNSESDSNIGKVVEPTPLGRHNTPEVPESLRKLVAEEKLEGTPSKELVKTFQISPASVSAYANGATSTATYNKPDTELKKHVNSVRDNIIRRATGKLKLALNEITVEKLASIKAKDAAAIAKDMSAIVRNLEPAKDANSDGPMVQFQFFAPRMRDEAEFEMVPVND